MKRDKNVWSRFDPVKMVRVAFLLLADIVLVNLAGLAALLVRFESWSALCESDFLTNLLHYAPVETVVSVAVFWAFRLYNSLWEYAGADELVRIALASCCTAVLQVFGMFLAQLSMPRSFPALEAVFTTVLIAMVRFLYRWLRRRKRPRPGTRRRTMLIGAGAAGAVALREFQDSEQSCNQVVCIIDDDCTKQRQLLRGVPIVGGRESILWAAGKYDVEEIILAIPSASFQQRRSITEICQRTGCKLKTLPAIYQLANGEVSIQKLRDIQIEDLLGRDPVQVDLEGIGSHVRGKVVLVTGGGGSIGSELCRQLVRYHPALLVIFDIYENNAYDIQQELRREYPEQDLAVLIGSIRDRGRVESVFRRYRPDLVYHAAAHKHVPLMEDSPAEAVKNNVFGTLNVAEMADRYGAQRMIMISSDKAVNPTNVMGATKRICEKVIQMVDRRSKTEFVSVRFGNVLGSNGSVIPLFKKQIAQGGPVTVTDKRIIRYFMTIPEAVSLVLQAGVYAKGGEIFILDMGDPVRIDDLARNMIRLSGYEPDVDIKIVYTGLRPGEKLFEELLLQGEGMRKTDNDLIYIGKDEPFDDRVLQNVLDELARAAALESDQLRALLHRAVPEYTGGREKAAP